MANGGEDPKSKVSVRPGRPRLNCGPVALAVALLLVGAGLVLLLFLGSQSAKLLKPQAQLIPPDRSLQEALDRAPPGTVIELVAGAVYRGPLVIRTPGLVLRSSSNGERPLVVGGEDVVRVEAPDVEIQGLGIQGGQRGLVINGADGVKVLDNRIVGGEIGIEAVQAHNLRLRGNEVRGARFVGITLSRAVSGSWVEGNRITQSRGIGLRLAGSSRNRVQANSIEDNPEADIGIEVSLGRGNHLKSNRIVGVGNRYLGIVLQSTQGNLLEGNSLQGAPIALQEERSYDNEIRDNRIEAAILGMKIGNSVGTQVSSNIIKDVKSGVYLLSSEGVVLRGNVVESASQFGLQVEFADRVRITGNTVSRSGVGVLAIFTQGSVLAENVLREDGWGMALLRSGGNTVSGNRARDNTHSGVSLLLSSTGNRLVENVLRDNGTGVRLILAPDNRVERNTFEGNGVGLLLSHSGQGTQITHNAVQANDIGVLVEALSEISDEETVLSQFKIPLHLPSDGDNEDYLIEENNLTANRRFGLKNADARTTIIAISNWWGDPSGPGGAGPGQGDPVSPNVSFTPWLEREATWTPSPSS